MIVDMVLIESRFVHYHLLDMRSRFTERCCRCIEKTTPLHHLPTNPAWCLGRFSALPILLAGKTTSRYHDKEPIEYALLKMSLTWSTVHIFDLGCCTMDIVGANDHIMIGIR